MIVLDSDVLTFVQRGSGNEYTRLSARLDSANSPVCTTIVSFEEQMRGWLALMAHERKIEKQIKIYSRLRALLEDFQTRPVLDFDEASAIEYQRLVKNRLRVGTMDLRIAAITLAKDGLLISRNLVDFGRVPGLRVEDWCSS